MPKQNIKDYSLWMIKLWLRIIKPWKANGWQSHDKVSDLTVDEAYAAGWNDCVEEVGRRGKEVVQLIEKVPFLFMNEK